MSRFTLVAGLFAVWFVGSRSFAAFRARRAGFRPFGGKERWRCAGPSAVTAVSGFILGLGATLGAPLFLGGGALHAIRLLATAIFLACCIDLLSTLRWKPAVQAGARRYVGPMLGLALAIGVVGYAVYLRSAPVGRDHGLQVSIPVEGRWLVASGGRSALTNHHYNNPPAQNYAVDLVREDRESEGAEVLAPVEGVVVTAFGERTLDSTEPEGNLVIIETPGGIQVWLAHLQEGSVRVAKGDRVAAGQAIGRCGSTGSASRAHVHIHAQKGDRPVAMFFGAGHRFLVRNNVVRSAAGNRRGGVEPTQAQARKRGESEELPG